MDFSRGRRFPSEISALLSRPPWLCAGHQESGSSGAGSGSTSSGSGSGSSFVSTPALTVSGAIEGSHVFIEGRSVEIWARWCSDHEVTQIEYYNVMGSSPSNSPGLNKPVEKVSWYDAITYCNKRSLAENLTPCYKVNGNADTNQWGNNISGTITCDFTADGYRLPTEAEWEYFARGGNTSNSGQTDYSGDENIESVAWYSGNSGFQTHEVKKKAANALGLYDMTGNVWEWCWDQCYDESVIMITTSTPFDGFASGNKRVLRGGSWFNSANDCKVFRRYMWEPNERSIQPCCGFRLVSSKSK